MTEGREDRPIQVTAADDLCSGAVFGLGIVAQCVGTGPRAGHVQVSPDAVATDGLDDVLRPPQRACGSKGDSLAFVFKDDADEVDRGRAASQARGIQRVVIEKTAPPEMKSM